MVVAPLKPTAFHAKIPSEPKLPPDDAPPQTLVVEVARDLSLSLNNVKVLGTTHDAVKLTEELRAIFELRQKNLAFDAAGQIHRAVFIKAPKELDYGSVAKVVDAVKIAGAEPIALQIDRLD